MIQLKSALFYTTLLLLSIPKTIPAQDLMCCSHATGSCRSVCEKISLVQLSANGALRNETIQEVQNFCSSQLSTFWECLNATFRDMSRGDSWSGRGCCPLPQSDSCRKACITATSILDLSQGCRQSDEIAFFSCLERQREGHACCENARDEDCRQACLDIFKTQLTPSKHQRQKIQDSCENSSPKVFECVRDFVKVTPAKNPHKQLHCCDKSSHGKCRETCKKILSMKSITFQEIIDGLHLGGCGHPLPQDYFWQCFMKPTEPITTSVEVSRIERVGMDSAKWHCCQRASSDQCQRLCTKTFTKYWSTSWDEFHLKCLSKISEESLRNCIDEVDEPCELGCDGLSFCTNFNNRPTELFRSCNTRADDAARNDVAEWQFQNKLTLPGLTLPLKNISQCSPNVWKAVACTLQVKPCSRHAHANQICRDVCLDILSKCVDWTRIPPNHSPDSICSGLSPEDPEDSCIDLQNFLLPSESNQQSLQQQVFSPCKVNPCEDHEMCVVNKNCLHSGNCIPYKCIPGCKLGEVSEYLVPEGAYVRIPIPNNNNPKGCLKICRCSAGRIQDCQPLPCFALTPCLSGGLHQLHGAWFEMGCNWCSCFAGEVICSKRQCEDNVLSGRNTAYTTLPCNCAAHYVPVCGRDGRTYPSACLAKCSGLSDSDIEHMPCEDPCHGNKCSIGQKCVPRPQVCLSLMHKPCPQYECVTGNTNCTNLPTSPVCDVSNKEYANVCHLAHHNSKLGYQGPCLQGCQREGRVCGFNGRTYNSECAAWADMVLVDYEGPCRAVGLIGDHKGRQCQSVQCRVLPDVACLGVTPPGACCPVCGGALRLLYSRKQVDRALYALQNHNTEALTLRVLLKALERQIQVAQCVLRGYVTVEADIFVVVMSTERKPSDVQLEACVREAEKIASLINMQSPRIVSELSLSSLTLANLVHTQASAAAHWRSAFAIVVLLLGMLLI